MTCYTFELIASNDHEELENLLNKWLQEKRPAKILGVEFVADGTKFTYCALVLYSV